MRKVFIILYALLFAACDTPVQEQPKHQSDQISEQFIKANQYMQRRHQDQIAAFVARVGWEAQVTASGLWVVTKEEGHGKKIEMNNRVVFTFESMLLDGTPCYEANEHQPKIVTVGKGGVESGVEQGLLFLRQGTEATFIIPPHLAHGNFGDRNKIPGNTVIIYHVRVLEVQ